MMKEETRLVILQLVEQVTPAGILLLEFFFEFFQKRGTVILTRPPSGMATDGDRFSVKFELYDTLPGVNHALAVRNTPAVKV